jgi:hypothetical protein
MPRRLIPEIPEPTEPGSVVLARYPGSNVELWTLTGDLWVSGSTRTTWSRLIDQRLPPQRTKLR